MTQKPWTVPLSWQCCLWQPLPCPPTAQQLLQLRLCQCHGSVSWSCAADTKDPKAMACPAELYLSTEVCASSCPLQLITLAGPAPHFLPVMPPLCPQEGPRALRERWGAAGSLTLQEVVSWDHGRGGPRPTLAEQAEPPPAPSSSSHPLPLALQEGLSTLALHAQEGRGYCSAQRPGAGGATAGMSHLCTERTRRKKEQSPITHLMPLAPPASTQQKKYKKK